MQYKCFLNYTFLLFIGRSSTFLHRAEKIQHSFISYSLFTSLNHEVVRTRATFNTFKSKLLVATPMWSMNCFEYASRYDSCGPSCTLALLWVALYICYLPTAKKKYVRLITGPASFAATVVCCHILQMQRSRFDLLPFASENNIYGCMQLISPFFSVRVKVILI